METAPVLPKSVDVGLEIAQLVASGPTSSRLPLFRGDALASLTTCNTNLNSSCDFHTSRKYKEYLKAWRQPAPIHCRSRRSRYAKPNPIPPDPELKERLGVNMDAICRSLVAS